MISICHDYFADVVACVSYSRMKWRLEAACHSGLQWLKARVPLDQGSSLGLVVESW